VPESAGGAQGSRTCVSVTATAVRGLGELGQNGARVGFRTGFAFACWRDPQIGRECEGDTGQPIRSLGESGQDTTSVGF